MTDECTMTNDVFRQDVIKAIRLFGKILEEHDIKRGVAAVAMSAILKQMEEEGLEVVSYDIPEGRKD